MRSIPLCRGESVATGAVYLSQLSFLSEPPAGGPFGCVDQWASGLGRGPVVGVDEAGRGPLAGPVVAGAVSLFDAHLPHCLADLNDSKQLTPAKRKALAKVISRVSFTGVGIATVEEIDQFNILNATFLAMQRALSMTARRMEADQFLCLVDGNKTIPALEQEQYALVKGDGRSWAIAAASVVAKVVRDRIMDVLHERDPRYGFSGHKGYGTLGHRRALSQFGPSAWHRKSFRWRPVDVE